MPRATLASCLVWLALGSGPAGAAPPLELGDGKAKDIRPADVISWVGFQATEDAQGKVAVTLRMTAKLDWQVYARNLKLGGPSGFELAATEPPPSARIHDPISGEEVDVYRGGEFTLTFAGAPRWTAAAFPVTVTYVGCTNVICLFPYTQEVAVAFTPYTPPLLGAAPPPAEEDDLQTRLARLFSAGGLSFGMLLAIVFAGGLLSNLTPCVAPMVPITLRLLAKQGKSPFVSASAYACGIVVTYSLLGLAAALSGGLFGSLLASKAFNLAFAAMMIGLGVTMLGFGDLSKLQMLGNRLGAGRPSLFNTFLMGTGAGLVAAPCTGPILAALLAYAAKNNAGVGPSTALLAVYSVGFALPYVLLGGAAAKVSGVKVSPRVQVAVKLTFAAVMFGLGLYYLRIPLYSTIEALKGQWWAVATWAGLAGVALTVAWTFIPALQAQKAAQILPTLVLGLGLFGASQWATGGDAGGHAALTVLHDEAQALQAAQAAGKPLLVDMWAEWCEACKKMDVTTFADPRVATTLAKDWIVLKLDLTESNAANDALQARYQVQSLPTLVLVPPSGKLTAKQAITGYVTAPTLINTLRQFALQRAE
jgi:thiol:disulfide interchange protein DsbD